MDRQPGSDGRPTAASNEVIRPLFIPLKSEYWDEFACGLKTTEYRLYGPRWNERTCRPGRPVVLSRGYGTRWRMSGEVSSFVSDPLACLDGHTYRALRALYPGIDSMARIACIGIELSPSITPPGGR